MPQIERGPAARSSSAGGRRRSRARRARRSARAARRAAARRARAAVPHRRAARRRDRRRAAARSSSTGWSWSGLGRAVERARAAGLARRRSRPARAEAGRGGLRPAHRARSRPTRVLVRHWGALDALPRAARRRRRPLLHGDFSLNVTNSVTARQLLGRGLDTLTAVARPRRSASCFALLDARPRGARRGRRCTTTSRRSTPSTASTRTCSRNGRDYRTCGRPCEQHRVALRDHAGPRAPGDRRRRLPQHRVQRAARRAPRGWCPSCSRAACGASASSSCASRARRPGVLAAYAELLAGRAGAQETAARADATLHVGVAKTAPEAPAAPRVAVNPLA